MTPSVRHPSSDCPVPVAASVRTEPKPQCPICHSRGNTAYRGLTDRLFGAVGEWNLVRCDNPRCHTLWLNPAPHPDDLPELYRTYYTHAPAAEAAVSWKRRAYYYVRDGYLAARYGYFPNASFWQKLAGQLMYLLPGRRAWTDFSVMYSPPVAGGRLLEVGCGSGWMLEFMQRLGWTVTGVDFDPAAVTTARERGLQVALGSLADQNWPDAEFDLILMSHVIEHVPDPQSLLAEAGRLLKPQGRLVVVTPNSRSLGHRWFGAAWLHLDPPRHLQIFSPESLSQTAAAAGLEIVSCETTIRWADASFHCSRQIARHGRCENSTRESASIGLSNKLLQTIQWTRQSVDSRCGEEIALIARKAA